MPGCKVAGDPYYKKNAEDLYKIVTDAGFTAVKFRALSYLWVKSPVATVVWNAVAAAKEERTYSTWKRIRLPWIHQDFRSASLMTHSEIS